jgi:hypothetical protein
VKSGGLVRAPPRIDDEREHRPMAHVPANCPCRFPSRRERVNALRPSHAKHGADGHVGTNHRCGATPALASDGSRGKQEVGSRSFVFGCRSPLAAIPTPRNQVAHVLGRGTTRIYDSKIDGGTNRLNQAPGVSRGSSPCHEDCTMGVAVLGQLRFFFGNIHRVASRSSHVTCVVRDRSND